MLNVLLFSVSNDGVNFVLFTAGLWFRQTSFHTRWSWRLRSEGTVL